MAVISRRGFLGLLGSVAAGTFVEPEHLVKVFDMAVQQPVRFYGGYGTGSMFNIWYADRMSRQTEKSVRTSSRRWGVAINEGAYRWNAPDDFRNRNERN